MKLFHGSNVKVEKPEILNSLRALDFGAGFYTTSSYEQASRWAKAVTKRRGTGAPTVTVYDFDETALSDLHVRRFEGTNGDWLDFVVANRKMIPQTELFDLVIGPVANDSTLQVIDDYMDGKYTKEQAIGYLMPQKLTDQYCFLTDKALKKLVLQEFKLI